MANERRRSFFSLTDAATALQVAVWDGLCAVPYVLSAAFNQRRCASKSSGADAILSANKANAGSVEVLHV